MTERVRRGPVRRLLATGLFVLLMGQGCVRSLTYSPSLYITGNALEKGRLSITRGMGKLVETRPDRVNSKTADGVEYLVRYSISERFALQFKYWEDRSQNVDVSRFGFSYANLIRLNEPGRNWVLMIMPTAGFVFADGNIEGGGGYFPFILMWSQIKQVQPYLAYGPAMGIRNISDNANQWGWGTLTTAGLSITYKRLELNFETSSIIQIDKANDRTDRITLAGLSIGVVLR